MTASRPKSTLQLKIQKKIQNILLDLFLKSEMLLGDKNFSISINDVDISPDLKNLKIFVDITNMERNSKTRVIKNLNEKNIFTIKKLLANKVNLRYVPEVLFVLDESNEKIYKMGKIIEKSAEFFKENID